MFGRLSFLVSVFWKDLNKLFLFIGLIKLKFRKMLKKTHNILTAFISNPTRNYLFEEIKTTAGSSSDSYTYDTLNGFVKEKILIKEKRGGVSFYKLANTAKTISYLAMVSEYDAWNQEIISENITQLIEKIKQKFFTVMVVGSYAKGKQTKTSDLDIIIISEDAKKIYAELRHYCEMSIPQIHLYVFTTDEFKQMLLSDKHNYGKEAVKNNFLFFGAQNYYKILFEAIKNGFAY